MIARASHVVLVILMTGSWPAATTGSGDGTGPGCGRSGGHCEGVFDTSSCCSGLVCVAAESGETEVIYRCKTTGAAAQAGRRGR